MKALDLFCGAGGTSVGLARAGFEVVGVDVDPRVERHWRRGMEPYAGQFIVADALEVLEEADWLLQFDFIWASPPCQAYSVATRITGRQADHPDLIAATRERLNASGRLYAIENVPGAPLGGRHPLVLLCGSMFGLQTPDGRAEIRRHRWFELSWPVLFRPQCQHGEGRSLSVSGPRRRDSSPVLGLQESPLCGRRQGHVRRDAPQGTLKRRAMTVAGNTPQTNLERNQVRETFSVDDARAAMQITWMPMKHLSQAIPPAYAEWIGEQAAGLPGGRGLSLHPEID